MRVKLVPSGLRLAEGDVPLVAGAVHYWRLDRRGWRDALLAAKGMGLRLVDTYVPWGVHEISEGTYDFSDRNDTGAFLDLVHELGLFAIVRPGPHINAELTYFGIPKRVIWDPQCQARSPKGNPVVLPMLPRAFPVPSYASEAFFAASRAWFAALRPILSPRRYPDGPIVLAQVDNEGALYFRDGAYDQDYHPNALAQYRELLREKYEDAAGVARAYGSPIEPIETIRPPVRFDAKTRHELLRHLDWAELHEKLLSRAMERFAGMLRDEAGLDGIPTMHNLPFGEETTALNAPRLAREVDLVAMDFYHRATAADRRVIARRTSGLAVHCEGGDKPPFAAEMGAGFPPFFPPLTDDDSFFTLMCALAYGLRGYSLYMAVGRDRWIGGPIDEHGRRRPLAHQYERLAAALSRVGFHGLRRETPVRLVTPRNERRLARVMHAFGPLTGAFFSVLGQGPVERCLEDDLGTGAPLVGEADHMLRAFEEALEARGVPFAHAAGEDRAAVAKGARWVVCGTSGGLHPSLFAALREAHDRGVDVTLGPRVPDRDQWFRELPRPYDTTGMRVLGDVGPKDVDALVAEQIAKLGLPTWASDPDGVPVTVHHDDTGPRVAFVMNPGAESVAARFTVPGVSSAEDALTGERVDARGATLSLRVPPRTVRMLAVSR